MCDPIEDICPFTDSEKYQKEVIDEYKADKVGFSKFDKRHYSQIDTDFTSLPKLLRKVGVPTSKINVTVIGGCTGEFARELRELGMNVIFTDPLEHLVKQAKEDGFESYQLRMDQIPKDLIAKTDLFATFECYYPFRSPCDALYNLLRILMPKYGLIFVESFRTLKEIAQMEKMNPGSPKRAFYFIESYDGTRKFVKNQEIRLTRIQANDKEKIRRDCKVMKILYDNYKKYEKITRKEVKEISKKAGLNDEQVIESTKRVYTFYRKGWPVNLHVENERWFRIQSQSFYYEIRPYAPSIKEELF